VDNVLFDTAFNLAMTNSPSAGTVRMIATLNGYRFNRSDGDNMIHAETNQIEHYKPQIRLVANSVLTPPTDLTATVEGRVVNLAWTVPIAPFVTLLGYNVYRNDELVNVVLVQNNAFADYSEKIEGDYIYHVTAVYNQGESRLSNPVEVTIGVSEDDEVEPLLRTGLVGNFPNPFNPSTTIRFEVRGSRVENPPYPPLKRGANSVFVQIYIYNIRGQRVQTLVDEYLAEGKYSVVWNGTDSDGQAVSSGLYLYKMVADDFIEVRKMMLLK